MAFDLEDDSRFSHDDPESLFRDLRSRKVEGLLSQQADMLRAYMLELGSTDVALELPTGSGKTLVGLLIAEWRRLKFGQRCVFLCPTSQLVHQVAEHARERYGINPVVFVGSRAAYDPLSITKFESASAIAISNYSTLFNSNTYFKDVGTIIFDDAHAGENYVSKNWSVEVYRSDPELAALFASLVELIEPHIPEQDKISFQNQDDNPIDAQWVNKLPTPAFHNLRKRLIAIFDECHGIPRIKNPWIMIRENLSACHFYYSSRGILIRPTIPPTEAFIPFTRAKQRIYMSATLGEGGDLERSFGTYRIKRIPAPSGWDTQGVGRRFFLFPMCTHSEEDAVAHAMEWISKFDRCLVLAPSDRDAEVYADITTEALSAAGYSLFRAKDVERSKAAFIVSKGVLVLANRYDGIDLNGDECRYLIVSGLPEATNLQERFLITRISANVLFRVRIRTRIIQAVGRCTRSATDWALVVVIGEKSHSYFVRKENTNKLHPELQAEIEFGLKQSLRDETAIEENIDLFIKQGPEWAAANQAIIRNRNKKKREDEASTTQLSESVKHEIRYANAIWTGNVQEALSAAADVVAKLSGNELQGYRAWWCYLAGASAYLACKEGSAEMQAVYQQWFVKAADTSTMVPWLKRLTKTSEQAIDTSSKDDSPELALVIERMETAFEKVGKSTSKKIESRFLAIREGLARTDSAEPFEQAQLLLGELLGYQAYKSEDDSAPDPCWVITESEGLVFEDYTAPTSEKPRIGKAKILQAKGHPDWLKQQFPKVTFKVIMCSATADITLDSKPFEAGVCFLGTDDMRRFAEEAIRVIRLLWDSFPGSGDSQWRSSAATILRDNAFAPRDVIKRLTQTQLSSVRK